MNRIKLLVYPFLLSAVLGAVLFGAAGRLDIPAFWIYLAVWLVFTLFALLTADEDLMRERLKPAGRSRDNMKLFRLLAFGLSLCYLVIAGLDQRYRWTGPIH